MDLKITEYVILTCEHSVADVVPAKQGARTCDLDTNLCSEPISEAVGKSGGTVVIHPGGID